MDVVALKEKLYENETYISNLLESSGFLNIRKNGDEFRCQWAEGHTNGGVQIKIYTLKANAYSMNFSGDIITLIQNKLDLSFVQSIKWISNKLGFEDSDFVKREIKLPFGGFFREIKREIYGIDECKTYSEDDIAEYGLIPCSRFLKDGISIATQEKYGVGYDPFTNRISVAWRNIQGEIIGVMGRINSDTHPDEIPKWFPLITFSKNNSIFGLYENYNSIMDKDICFVGESEKTAMVLDSMGMEVGLGLGGNVVSETKANLIKSTRAKSIIFIMDEGLDEDVSIRNAKMLKSDNTYYKNRVGYVFDRDSKYLPKGSKASPYDYGKEVFEKLIKECIIWV